MNAGKNACVSSVFNAFKAGVRGIYERRIVA
jgi:hypothetical protein